MVKFINYWMFATHIWLDAKPTPVAINLREILHIEEKQDENIGEHICVYLKNNNAIPIEGDIINVLDELQKHLKFLLTLKSI